MKYSGFWGRKLASENLLALVSHVNRNGITQRKKIRRNRALLTALKLNRQGHMSQFELETVSSQKPGICFSYLF